MTREQIEQALSYDADQLAASLRESSPEPTCATCRHNFDVQEGVSLACQCRTLCKHPKAMDANKGLYMMVPYPFSCPLHEPVA